MSKVKQNDIATVQKYNSTTWNHALNTKESNSWKCNPKEQKIILHKCCILYNLMITSIQWKRAQRCDNRLIERGCCMPGEKK